MDGVHFTTPEVEKEGARFDTKITIENSSDIESKIIVNLKLHDEEKQIVVSESLPMTICENEITEIEFSNSLSIPNLWSPESPKLYNLVIQLEQDDVIIDEQTKKVGFRKIQFSHDSGFKLNGEVVKLKGVCEHHTAGAVGSAVPDETASVRLSDGSLIVAEVVSGGPLSVGDQVRLVVRSNDAVGTPYEVVAKVPRTQP